jgi:CheY-like chemotaxis protein
LEEIFQVRTAEKGLTLMVEPALNLPRYIFSDEKKLRQVFFNILSNAVKFTQHGGITLRSRVLATDDPEKIHLSFEVEDTGPGIPADQIKDLFNYFVQTDAGKNSLEGTGLGLSICKNFVHMLDGSIRVVSEPGKGSIFIFDILARNSTSEEIVSRPRERRVIGLETGQRTWRILIAEDREANRKLLVKLLQPFVTNKERPGFEIREAVNGMQAVQIWEEWEPDLIFMDMRMPEMNGHQATQKIRASTRGQATKIIALTASAFEEERQVILSEGIDDFIRKPFKEYEIFNALSKHLEDVHFIYAEVQFPAAGLLMPEALPATLENVQDRNLPAAWVARLKYAAAAADGEQILELLQEIAPDQPAQASTIENLVRQYRFDLILKYF